MLQPCAGAAAVLELPAIRLYVLCSRDPSRPSSRAHGEVAPLLGQDQTRRACPPSPCMLRLPLPKGAHILASPDCSTPGQHGFSPEALAAYQSVRVPLASEVQRWSLKVGPRRAAVPAPAAGRPAGMTALHAVESQHARACAHADNTALWWPLHFCPRGGPPSGLPCFCRPSPAPQLLRQFQEGKPGPGEVDVNISEGFVKRQHAPLVARPAEPTLVG